MSSNTQNTIIIKFDQASDQISGKIRRVSGFVKIKHLLPLITHVGLEANPRDSKVGPVTEAIVESLQHGAELFPFKTKGLLIGASGYKVLDRGRYQITFHNPEIEGILDGGHNTLAIGLYVLGITFAEDPNQLKAVNKIKLWEQFKTLWEESLPAVEKYRSMLGAEDTELETQVPVELVLPVDPEDATSIDIFNSSLFEICSARNNNVQLNTETKSNAIGHYEMLKSALPTEIADRVKWRQNEAGDYSPGDIIQLVWIALGAIPGRYRDEQGKMVEPPAPMQSYSGKGECVARFERLMSSNEVSSEAGAKRELFNTSVHSGISLGAQIPSLFDRIYAELPALYNATGGTYGRIASVKKLQRASKMFTKFTKAEVKVKSPDGFVVPLAFGLRALIKVDSNGILSWKTNPNAFLDKNLKSIVATYADVIQALDWDPQKVGKSNVSYTTAYNAFETAYLRSITS